MTPTPETILSREVITEWAERGQRGKRRQGRADELRAHVEVGEPIKAALIALTQPLVDFISTHGLAGVSIPMQDTPEAKDIHIDCFPLYEEIECVLDRWGCIYVEVDTSTSRQRIADSHEQLRADLKTAESELSTAKERIEELTKELDDNSAARTQLSDVLLKSIQVTDQALNERDAAELELSTCRDEVKRLKEASVKVSSALLILALHCGKSSDTERWLSETMQGHADTLVKALAASDKPAKVGTC